MCQSNESPCDPGSGFPTTSEAHTGSPEAHSAPQAYAVLALNTYDLASRCVAPLSHEGSRSMLCRSSLRTLALAAAGVSRAAAVAVPAVASATVPAAPPADHATDWGPPHPRDWDHPEWGPGWNNGYPAPGWYPPAGGIPAWLGSTPSWVGPWPGHFSTCSTRCAARNPRSEPAPGWGRLSRSKIELAMSSPMPMPAPVTAGGSAVRSAASPRHEGPPCG
jgi:hypothetical protein